jgi:Rv2525c-like, glycoside hydrolase-like domain
MKQGVDFAVPATPAQLHGLKQLGKKFVCRYVSTPGNPKNLTAAEVKDCHDLGLDIVIVFETTANRAALGFTAGANDAKAAQKQLDALGIPTAPIYFAVDFDASAAQLPPILDYLKAASSVLGKRTGVYGGYRVVKAAKDAGVVRYAWQTYAWSYGSWDKRNELEQYQNGQKAAGLTVDLDRSKKLNYGQYPQPYLVRAAARAKVLARLKVANKAVTVARQKAAALQKWLKAHPPLKP